MQQPLFFKTLNKTVLVLFAILSTLSISFFSLALDSSNTPPSIAAKARDSAILNKDFLKNKIAKSVGLEVVKVEETPVPGIALLVTNQGVFYASYNGDYFIQGKVYSVANSVTDLAEASLAKMRLEGVKKFSEHAIVYPAKDEKYVVNVFTDITCGYCRKMHEQMDDYNARGITFRYLAYPRSGINDRLGNPTQGFKDLRSVWCNENPADALTKAKSGSTIAYRICDQPIEEEFNFGRQVGVSGTPAIILSNGMMIPGYQPPAQLEELLEKI